MIYDSIVNDFVGPISVTLTMKHVSFSILSLATQLNMSNKQRKDPITTMIVDPLIEFHKKSKMLLNIMVRPSKKEYFQLITMAAFGVCILGFVGYFNHLCVIGFVKLFGLNFPESLSLTGHHGPL